MPSSDVSGQRDSNTRPPGPKPGTLPTALYPDSCFSEHSHSPQAKPFVRKASAKVRQISEPTKHFTNFFYSKPIFSPSDHLSRHTPWHHTRQKHTTRTTHPRTTKHEGNRRQGYPQRPARISSTPCEDILNTPRGYPRKTATTKTQHKAMPRHHATSAHDKKATTPYNSTEESNKYYIF